MYTLKIEAAMGAMRLLAGGAANAAIESTGISHEDYEKFTGPEHWLPVDHHLVRRAFDAIVFGVMYITGTPRFELNAEYIAGAIAVFVHPSNSMIACRIFEGAPPMEQVASGNPEAAGSRESVSAEKLHALVASLIGNNKFTHQMKTQFEKRTNLKLHKTKEKEVEAA